MVEVLPVEKNHQRSTLKKKHSKLIHSWSLQRVSDVISIPRIIEEPG